MEGDQPAVKILMIMATTVFAHPLANGDDLPTSVLNEVEHALAIAPKATATTNGVPEFLGSVTNGASRTQMAVRLVSRQRADGRWLVGTNDVTAAAVRLLEDLAR